MVLAAELGKSLLEHNMRLKSSYDSLLQTHTPPITPSTSTVIQEEEVNEEEVMRFIPSRTTREAMIEVLEKKNVELSGKLEAAIVQQENLSKSNSKKTRQLENEISLLKGNLDIASNKIQELQDMNQRQKKMDLTPKTTVEDADLVEELYTEIDKIQQEKEQANQSKAELESKLSVTLKDLGELKKQFEKFDFTQNDFDQLKEAYERQFNHIDELKGSLEEHRTILQKLKERGVSIHSTRSTPASSIYGGAESLKKHSLLGELEIEWLKSNTTTPVLTNTDTPLSTKSEFLSSSHPFLRDLTNFTEKSLTAFYNAPSIGLDSVLSKATGLDQHLLDDALRFIDQIETEHNEEKAMALYNNFDDEEDFAIYEDHYPSSDLYPSPLKPEQMQIQRYVSEPKTFVGRLRKQIHKLFNLVWRWCRFTMVLTTALLISAWQGPDALLLTY